jgi:tetratricopeptide (TPR) repeat protein
VRRLALALVLAAGVADANVWQRAVDRGVGEARQDVYEAAMRSGDEAALQAKARMASPITVERQAKIAIDSYRRAAAAKPDEGEPWARIGDVIYEMFFDCEDDPRAGLGPRSPLCKQGFDPKRAQELIAAWDEFEKRAPLDPRLTYFDADRDSNVRFILSERAIMHTKLIDGADPKTLRMHLEAAAHDYEKILARANNTVEQAPSYEQWVGNLAETYMMLGRLDDAIEMYRHALPHGAHGSTLYGYAVALDRDDRGDQAKEFIVKQGEHAAMDFHTEVANGFAFFVPKGEVYYYYALIAEAFGQSEDAIENWQLYIRSGAHPEFQPRAKQHLDALLAKRVKRAVPHLEWDIDL